MSKNGIDTFAITIVICVSAVYGLAFGLTYPLLAIVLEGQGHSPTLIGLNTAMTPLGIIVTAPLIPRLARRLGTLRLAIACALLTAAVFAAIGLTRNIWWWFPLRFLLGAAIDCLYVISETWLLQLAGSRNRGRFIGMYGTLMAGGFAIGPFVLAVTGTDGWLPLGIGIAVMLLTTVGLLALRSRVPVEGSQTPGQVFGFMKLAPMLLLTVAVVAMFDQVALSLLPVYLLSSGFDAAMTAIALGVFAVGNVALQYPIGLLSDKYSRAKVAYACLACALVCCALLPIALESAYIWAVLFILGSTGFGIYTVTLAELGDRYEGEMLLAGNAAFAMMWGVGGVVGPPAAGSAMDMIGSIGLPVTLFAGFCLLLVSLRGYGSSSGNTDG